MRLPCLNSNQIKSYHNYCIFGIILFHSLSGVDDVFVFVNTFRQADSIKDPALRMAHTITTAGGATFFTSITTAGAFGANMASQVCVLLYWFLHVFLFLSFSLFVSVSLYIYIHLSAFYPLAD